MNLSVGAIRWDGWFQKNDFEQYLVPAQWHDRLPFYATKTNDGKVTVCSDSAEVMDQEIALASAAGLDYWAFCHYHPKSSTAPYNYGLHRFLAAPNKRGLKFCFLLQGPHLGSPADWPATVADFIKLFQNPDYQKVAGGRPILYMFYMEGLAPHFGSEQAAREALDFLRSETAKTGLPSPYLVAQVFSATAGIEYVKQFGFDAIGAYSLPGTGKLEERSYADLAEANRNFWEQSAAAGQPLVPLINAGWDGRPRLDSVWGKHYRDGPWYRQPTPTELANHLGDALRWTHVYPDVTPARSVLIYAWNESDEGGWLVPTHAEGNTRLDAIKTVLKA